MIKLSTYYQKQLDYITSQEAKDEVLPCPPECESENGCHGCVLNCFDNGQKSCIDIANELKDLLNSQY